jgi:hypothetical protein
VKRLHPLLLFLGGVMLLVGGFIYDVLFAGIPYQDPTPEMSARYAHHAGIASLIRWCGAIIFVLGVVAAAIRRAAGKSSPDS